MRRALLTLLVLLPLSGCLSGDGDDAQPEPVEDPDWAVRAIFLDQDAKASDYIVDHDHGDAAIHRGLSTPNFQLIGHDPLLSEYYGGSPSGTYYCGDVTDGAQERRLAVIHSWLTDVALYVLDVTDPADPFVVGELVMQYAFTYDVAVAPDGRYAGIVVSPDLSELPDLPVLGTAEVGDFARTAESAGVLLPATWRNMCGEEYDLVVESTPNGYTTVLVDLADPARPTVADQFQDPSRNMHSVSMALIDGEYWVVSASLQRVVACAPTDTSPVPQPCQTLPQYGNLASHFNFFNVAETPLGPRLEPYGTYSQADAGNPASLDPELLGMGNFHVDGTLQQHPLTGDLVAYMANWDGGLIIARLDGPGQITHLATWGVGDDAKWGEDMTGNVHSAVPLGVFEDGRHYTLTGQEVVGRLPYRPTGEIVLLDTTDPAAPTPVARWTLPVDVQWSQCCIYSPHYPIHQDGFLFVPLYHGGVWAADMRPAAWPELPSVGVFLPDMPVETEPVAKSPAPEVLEALPMGDGTLLVLDGNSGAYRVRFTGFHEDVPPAAPWTEDAWIGRR